MRDATSRSVFIENARSRTPTTLERSPACNFHSGDSFALRRSTMDESRRSTAQNASNLARISTSDYIILYPIISEYTRLCQNRQTISNHVRLSSMNPDLDKMGPDRRKNVSINSYCLPRIPSSLAWRASKLLQQCKADNH